MLNLLARKTNAHALNEASEQNERSLSANWSGATDGARSRSDHRRWDFRHVGLARTMPDPDDVSFVLSGLAARSRPLHAELRR